VGVAGCHASTSARSFDNYCANQIAPIHPTYDELPVSAESDGVCGHSRPDPTGAALPVKYGPWDRAEAPWDGRHAGLVADIRGLLEDRAAGNCG
jgi:hypothetical protein